MRMRPSRKQVLVTAGVSVLIAAGATGAAIASSDDAEPPITGADLERATEAALAETGGGEVTDTEVGDEESRYEVEVTLPDGSEVDVQLDREFRVVGTEGDDPDDRDDGDE